MTSNSHPPQFSEEDIRTRVVATWLADHGFTAESISVEFSFELRLGRNAYRVGENAPIRSSVRRPRADVLVRSCDGRNLLIVEVKAPNEILNDDAKEQGISYARLLRNGGIAPFVVLTNGHETRIYDSISGELIRDTQVPTNHRHVQNGFRVNVNDIDLRTEALETFVSLSSENLLEFCRTQVSYRMRLLRSDDPFSGKKYIPSLYIEREDAKRQLNHLIDEEKRQTLVLFGSPQVGKTNFICHAVEKRLEKGVPCLFYPAIGMQGSLVDEINEDFGWIFKDSSASHQIVNKLTHILRRTNQSLNIFIDGWNEASQESAQTIDSSSARLSCDEIQIIISLTDVAARRLLLDKVGNPSHIAESALLNSGSVPLLEISPEKLEYSNSSVMEIRKYNPGEIKRAYDTYSNIYKVQVPHSHQQVNDPFLLRIGMELFTEKSLPESLDEPSLLEKSIFSKISRAVDLSEDVAISLLSELADEMVVHDAPVSQVLARKRWNIPTASELPKGLFEAALLSKVYTEKNVPGLDFYYGRERDFVIACWMRNWFKKSPHEFNVFMSKLATSVCNSVEIDAIYWFLKQPQNFIYLEFTAQIFHEQCDPLIKRGILSLIHSNLTRFTDKVLTDIIKKSANDSSKLVRAETAKLITKLAYNEDWLASILADVQDLRNLVVDLLEVDEEYSLSLGNVGQIILDALRQLHWEASSDEGSEITDILSHLMQHYSSTVRIGAAKALGYIEPKLLFQTLTYKIGLYKVGYEIAKDYIGGLDLALDSIGEIYYGSMCPGHLEYLLNSAPEEHIAEHEEMYKLCMPIIKFYWQEECGKKLLEFLNSIAPDETVYENASENRPYSGQSVFDENIVQLSLPLDDLEPNGNA
ncbi:type I restriction enzyme HsdR N-terminal domain-containing protein [Coleofasciculus sp. FACHB-SPT9]|uniref:type I restriction enzyme HsdR N-terminal domain-containing protein n=1 Tax=Cyanophyceae TaxID=3028117 RepID=UPI00168564F9|nr:type I restriction enzyme HsdR N-terminal domain-containing protein [Coleofasciculus sp. FACHB-SPT9]MBD1890001.1 type I restriction enzyme HsdR N-terminal domain-containing protein [Coleofasciculus sp. FACHB-SPT9]